MHPVTLVHLLYLFGLCGVLIGGFALVNPTELLHERVSPSFAARCPATRFVQLRGVLEHTIVTLLAMSSEAGAQAGACFRTLARAR